MENEEQNFPLVTSSRDGWKKDTTKLKTPLNKEGIIGSSREDRFSFKNDVLSGKNTRQIIPMFESPALSEKTFTKPTCTSPPSNYLHRYGSKTQIYPLPTQFDQSRDMEHSDTFLKTRSDNCLLHAQDSSANLTKFPIKVVEVPSLITQTQKEQDEQQQKQVYSSLTMSRRWQYTIRKGYKGGFKATTTKGEEPQLQSEVEDKQIMEGKNEKKATLFDSFFKKRGAIGRNRNSKD